MFLRVFYSCFFAFSGYCFLTGWTPKDPVTGLLALLFMVAVAFTGSCVLLFLLKGIALLGSGLLRR